jgi:molybdopterin-containing oxidoreductase family iron-sulfur binding subunit
MTDNSLDLAAIQARLAQAKGKQYWRSLEEIAQSESFLEFLHREFPGQAAEWGDSLSRRNFLKLMAASLALAGLTACSATPPEKIVPFVRAPEGLIPGQPLFFATAMPLGGYGSPLLVQSTMNRPTKIEGNPDHPASRGASDALAQASILSLYDPDRAKSVTNQGQARDWPAFLAELQVRLDQQRVSAGAGLRILSESLSSPSLNDLRQSLLAEFPAALWHAYEPINRDNVYAGARLAFAEPVEPIYHIAQAEVILSLDADFFSIGPGRIPYAGDFASRRRATGPPAGRLNRLYAVESTPTITGAGADHRLPLPAGQVENFARALARALGLAGPAGAETAFPEGWVSAIARDLEANRGRSLVIPGDHQPPAVHALAHAINETLGNQGQTVSYIEPVLAEPASHLESLAALTAAMRAGQVEVLLILAGNPLYDAPGEVDFAGALAQVDFRVHLGLYEDETSAHCHWHLPLSHYLESWGDIRAYDGTVSLIQPLLQPLYDSRSTAELLAALLGQPDATGYALLRAYWQAQLSPESFETVWQTTLHDGVMAGSAFPAKTVSLQEQALTAAGVGSTDPAALELIFQPDPTLWDGRFANNGWLQELPKPLTKLTWDNAALFNPATAGRLGLNNGDLVELTLAGQSAQFPVWLMPGQPEGSVTVQLGAGRSQAGQVGNGHGFNAYPLRRAESPWFSSGLQVRATGQTYPLASTQTHHSLEGRHLIRSATLAEFAADPAFVEHLAPRAEAISLYPKVESPDNAWGMTIDLAACNGCNACVVACQAENNIPIVGKAEVLNGREMHWLRLDRYYAGELANPATYQQPVLCMHCENAPCEVVCPVAATLHDHEGLNTMIYNRCVGTRYCSNNCPYKVRRFNFLQYADETTETLKLQRNPNVTIRSRGVMEKCTYCVQRISAARITAKNEGRAIRDGEVVTACQAACPTQAIVFGNINDPNSQVAQLKASPLNYGLLTELNTAPATTYLAKISNPNPELTGETN